MSMSKTHLAMSAAAALLAELAGLDGYSAAAADDFHSVRRSSFAAKQPTSLTLPRNAARCKVLRPCQRLHRALPNGCQQRAAMPSTV